MLNKLRDDIHKNAVNHGWWDEERSFGDIIALCHSELSEALEEYRKGATPFNVYFICQKDYNCGLYEPGQVNPECQDCLQHKPEGIPTELADTIIRILDYCGKEGIDIEAAINIKHEYNKTRPYKHGGKKI